MLRTLMLASLLMVICATSRSATWNSIYTSSLGTISVDRSALRKEGPLVDAMLLIVLREPGNLSGTVYDKRSVKLVINCATRQYSMMSESLWLHGKLVKEWQGGPSEDFDIDPDKPLADAADVLCGKA